MKLLVSLWQITFLFVQQSRSRYHYEFQSPYYQKKYELLNPTMNIYRKSFNKYLYSNMNCESSDCFNQNDNECVCSCDECLQLKPCCTNICGNCNVAQTQTQIFVHYPVPLLIFPKSKSSNHTKENEIKSNSEKDINTKVPNNETNEVTGEIRKPLDNSKNPEESSNKSTDGNGNSPKSDEFQQSIEETLSPKNENSNEITLNSTEQSDKTIGSIEQISIEDTPTPQNDDSVETTAKPTEQFENSIETIEHRSVEGMPRPVNENLLHITIKTTKPFKERQPKKEITAPIQILDINENKGKSFSIQYNENSEWSEYFKLLTNIKKYSPKDSDAKQKLNNSTCKPVPACFHKNQKKIDQQKISKTRDTHYSNPNLRVRPTRSDMHGIKPKLSYRKLELTTASLFARKLLKYSKYRELFLAK